MHRRIKFMNIRIDNVTLKEAVDYVDECVNEEKKLYVVTPNVDHLVKLQRDDRFLEAYRHAGLVAVDGTPIMIVSRLYHMPLKEKITGPRLTEAIIKLASDKHYSIFFLGGAPGVAARAAKKMKKKYPSFTVAGSYSPMIGFENDEKETNKIITLINDSRADIVIAGIGSPKTEIFLHDNYKKLTSKVDLSIGATIDFLAGNVKRCPKWINKIGMEWFYRFTKEPKRLFKRYFVDDVAFLRLIFKYRCRRK